MQKRRGELPLPPLPQLIRPGLKLLFVGFNPGQRAAEIGHYYAHPSNSFWRLLHQAGFTERQFKPEEDARLLEMGYGLTDIVARPSKTSNVLAGWEFRQGREELLAKLRQYQPAVVCYNGLGVYRAAAQMAKVSYGRQPHSIVPGIIDFVAASPSGLSREKRDVKLQLYRDLYALVQSLPN